MAGWGLAAMVVFGGTALWLTWGGSRDPRALFLAGVFVTIASAFAYAPAGGLRAVLGLRWTADPWWNAILVEAFLPLCLWCFVRAFPRLLVLGHGERLIRAAIGVSAAAGTGLFLLNLARALGAPPPAGLAGWLTLFYSESLVYWGLILTLAAPALPVCLLRARSATASERRRVSRFALGLMVGLAPLFLEVLAEALFPPFQRLMDAPAAQLVARAILFPALLSLPLITAHSVVTERLLDVRVLLGRAARYLLARATLMAASVLPLVGLLWLLFERRAQPLAALVSGPEGALLLSAAGAGLLLLLARGRLMRRLDAVFDRSRVDWPRLRLRVGQLLRLGQTPREAAEAFLAELARELQVETAALLDAGPDRRWFVSLAGLARPLRGDSALAALTLAEPGSPLSAGPGDPGSAFSLLPDEDRRWLLDTRTELLMPLSGSDGRTIALLTLGAKRSEAPYTDDERSEVASLSQTVALALENRGLHAVLSPASRSVEEQELPATECPACGRVHPTERERCTCDTPLVAAPLPRVLFGKLELQERLGEGGMGLVYRAFDRELERSVALKTLPRASEEATQRLRREARSMAAVSHPGVAAIHGVESWQGLPILIVEHLAGGTLARRLGVRWPIEKALVLGLELADALEAIHRRGLLHGDVKPSNIGFDGEERPKLLDFGLAHIVEPLAQDPIGAGPARVRSRAAQAESSTVVTKGIAGTPLYMCPEVLAGATPGPHQDLWSLVLVLFELVAGTHPFRGARLDETLDRIRRRPLPDIRQWAPGCPKVAAVLFAKALHRDPKQRPASAAALHSELRELLGRLP